MALQTLYNLYKKRFGANMHETDLKAFEKLIKSVLLEKISCAKKEEKIVIFLTPWVNTSVPYFSFLLAYIYRFQGYNVRIIWDDLLSYNEGRTDREQKVIEKFLFSFEENVIPIKRLSMFDAKENNDKINYYEVERLAKLKTIHQVKSATLLHDSTDIVEKYKKSLMQVLPFVTGVFSECTNEVFIIPGGICANTGLFYLLGKKYPKVRIASYDSGERTLLLGKDNVATHLRDIETIILNLNNITDKGKERYCKSAKIELSLRMSGNDKDRTQKINSENDKKEYNYDIFIPLNIEWDSAALGMEMIFEDSFQWLKETIEFTMKNTEYTIIIRQHPHERRFNSSVFLKQWFKKALYDEKRIRFVSCDENINSYSILKNVKVVLPWSSTIGIEAAMLGKNVVVHNNCYYSKLPFVISCDSKKKYFEMIVKCIEENMPNQHVNEAEICYYFSQCCNWTRNTNFTPIPADFNRLIARPFEEIVQDETIQDILKCLCENIPMALLNHYRNEKIFYDENDNDKII
ncbi:hypothetical protein SDC9_14617 [bioreactor metagenome]|uniref:Capsule polysaccharide biosynthesis protein n=1 Tax=bioreactor metagenome TaxID=1076179 RepID=A0A644TPN6_9ZZZZ